ncbi:TIGR01777 family protein [Salicibibacter halophilus]|uniref:TIGR01777 family protein n=1 Tax=Salicibibacter halophilus TaxID=2502791 RepID=A0A514LLM0_9BACI|nr:TIGR01777 family oxidoreductase [Salicibibacter halophilus]QDI92748.1 TIGR01777 family protein [Salicibibacter halophilus]
MHIVITGGTGLVGKALTEKLRFLGHSVSILTRNAQNKQNENNLQYIEWLSDKKPEKELKNVDAIVNLAGASISSRWTKKHKARIKNSRMEATRECIRLMENLEHGPPNVFVSASAMGYYGISETDAFTEDSAPANQNFLQEVSKIWEKEAQPAEELGVRTVYGRFGLILDNSEGALPKMMLPYKLGVGGPIGNGKQWYSWVHRDDVAAFIIHALEQAHVEGVYNVTAPNPERMRDFGKKISNVLNRPHWLPTPAFAVRTALGEMSVLVTDGQKVIPERTLESGFRFQYEKAEEALASLLEKE